MSPDLTDKIKHAELNILEFYYQMDCKTYIGFSGGRDSAVLCHLIRRLLPKADIPTVYCATGLEYPEVHEIGRKADVVLNPAMTFKEVVEKYGWTVVSKDQSQKIEEYRNTKSDKLRNIRWNGVRRNGGKMMTGKIAEKWKPLVDAPFKITSKCCDVFKKNPSKKYEKATGRHPFTGERSEEGMNRRNRPCNTFGARPKSKPLNIWTLDNIKEYCATFGVVLPEVYSDRYIDGHFIEAEDRTGCMFCMIGAHRSDDAKFEKMKVAYPKQYAYIMDKLGGDEVLRYVESVDEMKRRARLVSQHKEVGE